MSVIKLVSNRSLTSESCADMLRHALSEAEAGRIVAVSVVMLDTDRAAVFGRVEGDNFMSLLGAMTTAQNDMMQAAYEGED